MNNSIKRVLDQLKQIKCNYFQGSQDKKITRVKCRKQNGRKREIRQIQMTTMSTSKG